MVTLVALISSILDGYTVLKYFPKIPKSEYFAIFGHFNSPILFCTPLSSQIREYETSGTC